MVQRKDSADCVLGAILGLAQDPNTVPVLMYFRDGMLAVSLIGLAIVISTHFLGFVVCASVLEPSTLESSTLSDALLEDRQVLL